MMYLRCITLAFSILTILPLTALCQPSDTRRPDEDGSSFMRDQDDAQGSQQERDLPTGRGSLSTRQQEQRQLREAKECERVIREGLPLSNEAAKRCSALLEENE